MSRAYYNEIDPYAADWLRTLVLVGLIAPGDVDTRSIEDITPNDLAGYDQCHFFAGIGGWSLALRLAGWSDDRRVWTGSCPCQPFSAAGKGTGRADERHLWPAWQWLIEQCRPRVIFGEQVEAAIKHDWLDLVQADLEAIGYATGAICLPAAGVGAPHARSRLWFVADDETRRRSEVDSLGSGSDEGIRAQGGERSDRSCGDGIVAESDRGELDRISVVRGNERNREDAGRTQGSCGASTRSENGGVAHHHPTGRSVERSSGILDGERSAQRDDADGCGADGELGHADAAGSQGRRLGGDGADQCVVGAASVAVGLAYPDGRYARTEGVQRGGEHGQQPQDRLSNLGDHRPDATNGYWQIADWISCWDGKFRPVEPGTFPLAHGIPARVGRLRAYGNAIVPQVAAEVIRAYVEVRGGS